MRKSGTEVVVAVLPACDFCKGDYPAAVDGKTTLGSWAYMCEVHFAKHGRGLGIGTGQRLTLKPKVTPDFTYEQWMKNVDRVLARRIGLSSMDLADFNSYDCWSQGMTPAEGAQEALDNDDTFGGME